MLGRHSKLELGTQNDILVLTAHVSFEFGVYACLICVHYFLYVSNVNLEVLGFI